MNKLQHKFNTRHLIQIGITTNIYEWYEFIVFVYLSEIIGKVFFFTTTAHNALLNSFTVVATSYLARPIGSIVFGYIGDKISIEYVVRLTIILMAVPATIIGVLPSYNQMGILSTLFLIILRLIQGFAAGGEYTGSASYIYVKSTNNPHKIILCCLPIIGSMLGVILSSLIVNLLFKFLDVTEILDWGWRIPFIIGIPIFFYTIIIRRQINPGSGIVHISQNSINVFILIKAFFIAGFLEISFYILLIWMPKYHEFNLHISSRIAHNINLIALITTLVSTLFFSYIAKFINYIYILRVGIILILVSSLVIFRIQPDVRYLYLAQIFNGVSIGCMQSVIFYYIIKMFPSNIRMRGISISFTWAAAFLGGTAPLLCTYFIKQNESVIFPDFYILISGVIALILSLTKVKIIY